MRRLEGPRTSGSRVLMPSEGCGCCPEVLGASEVLQQQEGGQDQMLCLETSLWVQ